MASSSPPGPTNLGLAPNLGALLCYLPLCPIGFVFSIVVAIVEKKSRFLRFHAFQSLLLHGAAIVLWGAFVVVQFVAVAVAGFLAFLVWLLGMGVGLAFLALLVLLMIKANNNEEFQLPVIGPLAKQWA